MSILRKKKQAKKYKIRIKSHMCRKLLGKQINIDR